MSCKQTETRIARRCTSEAISITENAGLMGIPLPAAWKNAIGVLQQGETDSDSSDSKTS
ncbi:MAG: phage holin family protein [Ruminococcus sp.]|nr:phage holin family protein [Ruminococcus sp.]